MRGQCSSSRRVTEGWLVDSSAVTSVISCLAAASLVNAARLGDHHLVDPAGYRLWPMTACPGSTQCWQLCVIGSFVYQQPPALRQCLIRCIVHGTVEQMWMG
jgi:hypothetical protein